MVVPSNWDRMTLKAWLMRNNEGSHYHPPKAGKIYERFKSGIDRAEQYMNAKHMIERYDFSTYTPYERAVDHACSYEANSPQFEHWINVSNYIDYIYRQRENVE